MTGIASKAAIMITILLSLAMPVQAQQRPDWLKQFSWSEVQRLNDRIDYFSKRDKVSRAALATIAESVGLSGSVPTAARVIEAVDMLSREAAKLKQDLAAMERQIRTLKDARVREPALEALGRANAAFERGDFDTADREFKQIEALRWAQVEGGTGTWSDALEAQIKIARLRYRFDEATSLARRKAAQANLQGRQLRQIEWEALISAGHSQERKAEVTGEIAALRSAEQIYAVDLAGFLRSDDDSAKRYVRMLLLGEVKGRIASKMASGAESMAVFQESNNLLDQYIVYARASKCNDCLAASLSALIHNVSALMYRTRDTKHLKSVEKYLGDSRVFDSNVPYYYRYGMHYAMANLYSRVGEIRPRVEDFERAERHAKDSIASLVGSEMAELNEEAALGSKFLLADIYRIRGEVLKDTTYDLKARDALLALIPEYQRLNRPHRVADLQKRLGAVLHGMAAKSHDCAVIRRAGAAIREANRLMSPRDEPNEYAGVLLMLETNRGLELAYCR
ncbi:MAG: hypothetical protein ABWX67_14340 [Allosphingosinicella sp.]